MLWDFLPADALSPMPEQRGTYECLRCNTEVTGALHREMQADGWVFYRVPGPDVTPAGALYATHSEGRDVALCGDCAAMLRTLQAIRMSRGVGDIKRRAA